MSQEFGPSNERISEEYLINMLDSSDIDSPWAIEALTKYIDQCHAEADLEAAEDPGSFIASNRANIKADIKVGILLTKTEKYKDRGMEMLRDAFFTVGQHESTADLADLIKQGLSE